MLLGQGRHVSDLASFHGEEAPLIGPVTLTPMIGGETTAKQTPR